MHYFIHTNDDGIIIETMAISAVESEHDSSYWIEVSDDPEPFILSAAFDHKNKTPKEACKYNSQTGEIEFVDWATYMAIDPLGDVIAEVAGS